MKDQTLEEMLAELDDLKENASKSAHSIRRPLRRSTKMGLALLAIVVIAGTVAAFVLFTHQLSFTPPALAVSNGCAGATTLTGTLGGSGQLIIFSCALSTGATGPLSVGTTSGLSVTASGWTVPTGISDLWVYDLSGSAPSTTCNTGTTTAVMIGSGAATTIPIASTPTAGAMTAGHGYAYCADYSTLPGAFTISVTWSQA